MEWWQNHAKEATVLGSLMQEGEGIYLWLQLPDVAEPRGYVLPWNRATAEQLQQAQREAAEQEGGGTVHMRMPFEPSLEKREPLFYAQPQPAPPPKDQTDRPPAVLPAARPRRLTAPTLARHPRSGYNPPGAIATGRTPCCGSGAARAR